MEQRAQLSATASAFLEDVVANRPAAASALLCVAHSGNPEAVLSAVRTWFINAVPDATTGARYIIGRVGLPSDNQALGVPGDMASVFVSTETPGQQSSSSGGLLYFSLERGRWKPCQATRH
jgi:hypothetical protein